MTKRALRHHVVVRTTCSMLVSVVACDANEAKRKACEGDYDPESEWVPVDYSALKAPSAYLAARQGKR